MSKEETKLSEIKVKENGNIEEKSKSKETADSKEYVHVDCLMLLICLEVGRRHGKGMGSIH